MVRRLTPGLYEDPAPPGPTVAVRDDVAAFVGLARRGPPDRAVRVESWEEFRACFGDRSAAFFLPDAVLGFFLNGGRVAHVVRVLHRVGEPGEEIGVAAQAPCPGLAVSREPHAANPAWVAAQRGVPDPGTWGNGVGAALTWAARPLVPAPALVAPTTLRLGAAGPGREVVGVGTMLQVTAAGHPPRFAVVRVAGADTLEVDVALTAFDAVAVVEATVEVLTADGQRELHAALGLDPAHPRYAPAVLADTSTLVALRVPGVVDPVTLYPVVSGGPIERCVAQLDGGRDGLVDLTRDDFFDPDPDDEDPGSLLGLAQLRVISEISLVVMPDLALPARPAEPQLPPRTVLHQKRVRFVCGITFDPPVVEVPEPLVRPEGLLDPSADGRWDDLAAAEARLVAYCEAAGDRIALLAPPPSLGPEQALRWRSRFDSPFAAAFYPWLDFGDPLTLTPANGTALRSVPPTGIAAGLIARAEARSGVGVAPANLVAGAVLGLSRQVSPEAFAALHAVSFDVFRRAPDGSVLLLGARTLSSDRDQRYLHARRLLTHVKRLVERRLGWAAFEPNRPELWSLVAHDLDANVLLPLYERGVFAGDTRELSYFIRCDATLNPRDQIDQGRLWCEVGIAPNVPAEYLVFRLAASPGLGAAPGEEG